MTQVKQSIDQYVIDILEPRIAEIVKKEVSKQKNFLVAPAFLSATDAAKFLGYKSTNPIYKRLKSGHLKAYYDPDENIRLSVKELTELFKTKIN